MPVEIIETTDSITALMQFRTSTIYEMLVSLNTILLGQHHTDLTGRMRQTLGDSFIEELSQASGRFWHGGALLEFAVDYPDHHDVPGFIEYVRQMDENTFLFYLTGRIIPAKQIAATHGDPALLVEAMSYYPHHPDEATMRPVMEDVRAFQTRITGLWERYWTGFFQYELAGLPERWADAIADKEHFLAREGGRALLELLTTSDKMPDPLPPNQPWTEIVCVPVYFISSRSYRFFGYGNNTVIFDSERTEERIRLINQNKEEALNVAKALGDSTRLSILQLIAQGEHHWHGKRLAEKLDLSPSAVSRALAQLRDSGLIAEEHHDNQTVTYRLVRESITSLPGKILEYLFG